MNCELWAFENIKCQHHFLPFIVSPRLLSIYLGVSNGLCEHANTALFFASTSIDKSQPCEQRALCKKLPLSKTEHASTCKNMRAWANEHPLKFCEQFEQKPNFSSTWKFWATIRYPFIYFYTPGSISLQLVWGKMKRYNCRPIHALP